jgi:predicted GNAT family N-acyltransferase
MQQTIDENTAIQLASSAEQIRSCYSVMVQLRPPLKNAEDFVEQVQRQQAEGYRLVFLEKEGKVRAVIGFRFLEFLAWGKVLYIDDLISDTQTRKQGYGGHLLKWTIEQAKNSQVDQVHLDSGSQRHDAHRLYLNHGFKIIGHHFALELMPIQLI